MTKKAATRIAQLFNSILVAQHMIASGYDLDTWAEYEMQAMKELREKFGIEL